MDGVQERRRGGRKRKVESPVLSKKQKTGANDNSSPPAAKLVKVEMPRSGRSVGVERVAASKLLLDDIARKEEGRMKQQQHEQQQSQQQREQQCADQERRREETWKLSTPQMGGEEVEKGRKKKKKKKKKTTEAGDGAGLVQDFPMLSSRERNLQSRRSPSAAASVKRNAAIGGARKAMGEDGDGEVGLDGSRDVEEGVVDGGKSAEEDGGLSSGREKVQAQGLKARRRGSIGGARLRAAVRGRVRRRGARRDREGDGREGGTRGASEGRGRARRKDGDNGCGDKGGSQEEEEDEEEEDEEEEEGEEEEEEEEEEEISEEEAAREGRAASEGEERRKDVLMDDGENGEAGALQSPVADGSPPSGSAKRGRGRPTKSRAAGGGASHLSNPAPTAGGGGGFAIPLILDDAMGEDVKDAPFMDAVVKVFCTHTEPNFSLPWQRKRQYSSNSSGFIIGGRRVLTNAHSVEHYTQVKVKRRGSDVKYLASVLAIGTECDIAMLTVEDETFWQGVEALQFGSLPRLQDAVTVVGYPIGGDTISVTSGVVSRIEVTAYVHGATELLGLQIDAAINAGNSGGPAFNSKGQCVGIAFQSLKHEDAENIGYVIPTPVITHFITDYERNGEYTGFPVLGIEWQKMENPHMRKALGMKGGEKGVRIRRVEPTAPGAAKLFASDILLSFDGVDIANDGTVPFRHGERISFSYLVSLKYTGEAANVRVLRGMKHLDLNVDLANQKRLVPVHIRGKPPSYYIVAGIVFTPVSVPYLRSEYGKDYDYEAPVKLLDKLIHAMATTEDQQVVVVSQVLVADVNIGYEDIVNTQVVAFNGKAVRNLKSLAMMVEACDDAYLRFELEYQQLLILEMESARAATQEILKTHCIPSAMSDDLKS